MMAQCPLSTNQPMIHFFRKIRQRLLNQGPLEGQADPVARSSHIGKYFIYAIGEIALNYLQNKLMNYLDHNLSWSNMS